MTILLVDSDKKALDLEMRRFTQQRPFAVTVSLHSSGDDAIRFSMCHDVDMVFTRAVLSDMTGRETVRKAPPDQSESEMSYPFPYEEIPISRFLGQSSFYRQGERTGPTLAKKNQTSDTDITERRRLGKRLVAPFKQNERKAIDQ